MDVADVHQARELCLERKPHLGPLMVPFNNSIFRIAFILIVFSLAGKNDLRVPLSQVYEYCHTLKKDLKF